MSRRVVVHHFVLADLARPETPAWRVWDLFRVSHWRGVPVDTEFPFTVPRMQLYTRFYLTRARPTRFSVRVFWDGHPSGLAEDLGTFGPYLVPFPTAVTVHDCSFTVHNLQLQGVGSHRVELLREQLRTWTADPWIPIYRTYFEVER
jgi:hypothetical protein